MLLTPVPFSFLALLSWCEIQVLRVLCKDLTLSPTMSVRSIYPNLNILCSRFFIFGTNCPVCQVWHLLLPDSIGRYLALANITFLATTPPCYCPPQLFSATVYKNYLVAFSVLYIYDLYFSLSLSVVFLCRFL